MTLLQQFFAELLEKSGAVLDVIEPEGLEVLAPPHVQQMLQLPELARLGFGAELPAAAQRVGLDSELMGRAGELLGQQGRHLRRIYRPENPPPNNPERMLLHTLELHNATYRLREVAPAWTCYVILRFRYTAVSDDKRDGVLDFGVNRGTGATVDDMLPELLLATQSLATLPALTVKLQFPPWTQQHVQTMLERALPPRVHLKLEDFFKGMRRRQERDLQRLYEYHQELRHETVLRLAALATREELNEKQQSEQVRERQRLEAIAREYQAKVSDVRQKYAMKVELEWVQTLEIVMPVQRFTLLLKRRKGERSISLDWNPLTRQLEQAPCEYSFTWERTRDICDEALHLVTPSALRPCPDCGKTYCRACHPAKCPKCGR